MYNKRLRQSWRDMKRRCCVPGSTGYDHYGGRGIRVCTRWLESFDNFFEDMKGGYEEHLTLDRIDNDGDYCKENCRRATRKEQLRNTRKSVVLKYKGIEKHRIERRKECRLPLTKRGFQKRITSGWSPKEIMERPVVKDKGKRSIVQSSLAGDIIGKFNSLTEASEMTGINIGGICGSCRGTKEHAGGYVREYTTN